MESGCRATQHIERVFRTLTSAHGGEPEDDYFRWVTREPHPLGNVVIQSSSSDGENTRAAIEPLLSDNLPSAVLFPAGSCLRPNVDICGQPRGVAVLAGWRVPW
jgi:hypothetical protein